MDVAVNIIKQLGIDGTVVWQLIIVACGIPLVAALLIKPLYQAYHRRTEVTVGYRSEAQQLAKKSEEMMRDYDERMNHVQIEVRESLDARLQQSQEESRRVLKDARDKATHLLEDMQKKSAAEVGQLREHLKSDMGGIVKQIVDRLMA